MPVSPDSVLHMLHQVLKRVGLSGDFSAWFTPEPCAHVTTVSQRQADVETALKSHMGQTKTERNQAAKETPSESVNSDGVLLFEKGYKRFLIIPRSADT